MMAGMRYISLIFLFTLSFTFAESLEERLEKLERKILQLEQRVQALEKEKNIKRDTKYKNPVELTLVSKKFKSLNLKERLWEKGDKIIFHVKVKNITGKNVRNIRGIFKVQNENGEILAEKVIDINKAFNFITGMDIKPGETVELKVSFLYDKRNPAHRYLKEADIDKIKIKFEPIEVNFSDGTVINYR